MGISWLVIIVGVTGCWATDYELVLEDPDIFSPCTEGPPGSIGVAEALNLDQLEIIYDDDALQVTGNVTVNWDVSPKDRIKVNQLEHSKSILNYFLIAKSLQGKMDVFYFNRGHWEPTVFSMVCQDFCSMMYDRNQYWYKMWTRFIINRPDVEKNCINTPGVSGCSCILPTSILYILVFRPFWSMSPSTLA